MPHAGLRVQNKVAASLVLFHARSMHGSEWHSSGRSEWPFWTRRLFGVCYGDRFPRLSQRTIFFSVQRHELHLDPVGAGHRLHHTCLHHWAPPAGGHQHFLRRVSPPNLKHTHARAHTHTRIQHTHTQHAPPPAHDTPGAARCCPPRPSLLQEPKMIER